MSSRSDPIESAKENSSHNGTGMAGMGLHADYLSRIDTATSVIMTKDLFEKLYLSPQTNVAGELRRTFANPTPLGFAGFLLGLSPVAADLIGWRGAGGNGAAEVGSLIFLGGLLLILASIGEFIMGNVFSVVTFGVYGGFFLAYGATLVPSFNAVAAYLPPGSPPGTPAPAGFLASFAFLAVYMSIFTFIIALCSIRTNICSVIVFLTLDVALICLATSNFYAAAEDFISAATFSFVSGIFIFVGTIIGWYVFVALMFAVTDFPVQLPVGDLSLKIMGYSERQKKSAQFMA